MLSQLCQITRTNNNLNILSKTKLRIVQNLTLIYLLHMFHILQLSFGSFMIDITNENEFFLCLSFP